ncbi:hypothetical protein IAR55_002459 [Kwoniella newhampshirensis]|uniref:Protein regulator of cytokinesis 1 n=1 Tax=Kwoniella newhampshirensis TaxID=1651941 RepID=A0AAW0Z1L4_9TREE
MSAYLDEQTPHLRQLHSQLSLPAEVLQADLARIEAAIRAVITSIIREREAQVDGLKDEIAQVKRDVASLARAVGEKGRDVVAVSGRESFENDTLPRQLERLTKQVEGLKVVYDERLQRVQNQQATLDRLSALLGSPYQPSKPLQPIASSSKHANSSMTQTAPSHPHGHGHEGKKRGSSQTLAQAIAGGQVPPTWYDVGESVTAELDEAVSKALEERDTRRRNLCQTLINLAWLHNELALPPVPTSDPHHFPLDLLPNHVEEETPGAYCNYERLLSKIISCNTLPPGDMEEWPEIEDLDGLESVEPEIGLIEWSDQITDLWNGRKEEHEARIQELFNLVEPLWSRLEVDAETTELFIEMNRGSGDATIKAYEAEYERLLEIRRSSLSSFIVNTRKEIDELQTELMMSEDERAEFGAFIDDDYTEELLHLHEAEIERLRDEVESKVVLLPKVREWHALVNDEDELERNSHDPNRFSRRGGAMLREEKLRKRVTILKPKIETELLSLLPKWEEEQGRPFMVSGERVVTKIQDTIEAKEMAKEAKKRAKQGLAPAKLLPRATPGPSTAHRSVSTSAKVGGKREAPTPTPLASYQTNKRQRLVPPSTGQSVAISTFGGSSLRPIGDRGGGSKMTMMTGRSVSAATARGGGGAASPTPFHGYGRTMSHSHSHSSGNGTIFGSSASNGHVGSTTTTTRIPALGTTTVNKLALADGRKPRRQSFKPRSSVLPSMMGLGIGNNGGGGALREWGVVEEDEDVF